MCQDDLTEKYKVSLTLSNLRDSLLYNGDFCAAYRESQ